MIERLRGLVTPAFLVAGRELRDQFRDWRILVPMTTLTIFFPFLMNLTARAALDFATQYGTPLIGERFVPFFLMVVGFFPITVSLVIALETFVGEKERGTIEPLLSSPLKDWQIFLGKLIASATTPLITAYLGIAVYLVGLLFQRIPLPDINRLAQTVVLTAVQGLLMVSGAILISIQATSVRAANLMSSFIIIPIALLIQGESILMFWGNNQILWLAVLGVLVLAILLIRVGLVHFQRESLLGREIDMLNLRWIWTKFASSFMGGTHSIKEWYRVEIPKTLYRLRKSILITLLIGLASLLAAYFLAGPLSSQLNQGLSSGELQKYLGAGVGLPESGITFPFIFLHNLRAILVLGIMGALSFGVLGVLVYILNMAAIGGVISLFHLTGLSSLLLVVYGILPHGIFEVPAVILSCGAILHLGVHLVTPNVQKSLGESLIEVVSDWIKITLSMVIPLLLAAAAIETWITPRLLNLVIK